MARDKKLATVSFNTALLLIAALIILPFSAADSDEEAEKPAPPCATQLLSMSSCLATMAAPSTEVQPEPTADCCKAFYSSLDSSKDGVPCLCQLIRKPELMQVPLNGSNIAALFSSCGTTDLTAATSFLDGCRGESAEASSPAETQPDDLLPSFNETLDNNINGNYPSQVLHASSGSILTSCYGWVANAMGTLYQIVLGWFGRQPPEPFQNQYIPFPKHPNDL